MHMADALISPIVGGTMLLGAAGVMTYSIRKIEEENPQDKIPLMSVVGAFVFAAQMINFTIPGTGASGHLGGGMLLAILLGPYAGFLAMGAILLIQALFFADGGLLAYGCNVFNLGFYTCFIAYPFIYKPIMRKGFSDKRLIGAIMLSSIVGLQLGAFSVVIETVLSGKTAMPFTAFLLAMQPIHLGIGIIEGVIVAAAVSFVYKVNPLIIDRSASKTPKVKMKKLIIICAACAFITGGVFSLFASSNPDGLEWAMQKITGSPELKSEGAVYDKAEAIQGNFAILPDYSFKQDESQKDSKGYTQVAGTTASGIMGSFLTFAFIALIGVICYGFKALKPNYKDR